MPITLRYMVSGALSNDPAMRALWFDTVIKETEGYVPSDPNPFPTIRLLRNSRHDR